MASGNLKLIPTSLYGFFFLFLSLFMLKNKTRWLASSAWNSVEAFGVADVFH